MFSVANSIVFVWLFGSGWSENISSDSGYNLYFYEGSSTILSCSYCSRTGKLLLVKGTTFSQRAHPIFFFLIESLSDTVSLRAYSKQILAMRDEYIKYEDFHHGRYRNKCCNLLSPLSRIVLENSGFITVSSAVVSVTPLWKHSQLQSADSFLGTIKENLVSFSCTFGFRQKRNVHGVWVNLANKVVFQLFPALKQSLVHSTEEHTQRDQFAISLKKMHCVNQHINHCDKVLVSQLKSQEGPLASCLEMCLPMGLWQYSTS